MKKIIVLLPFLLFRILSNSQSSLVVNNKLIGNKILIKEDFSLFATAAAIWLAYWTLNKLGIIESQPSKGVSKNVENSLDDIYKDKNLVKDFVNILRSEGNIDVIVDKARSMAYKEKYPYHTTARDVRLDNEDWNGYIRWGMEDWNWEAEAKRVAQRVVKSNGYKKFAVKHKFTKEDDTDMIKIFYFIISRPDFAKTAKTYLYTMVDKDIASNIKAVSSKAIMPRISW
jgi:hypothetical protein